MKQMEEELSPSEQQAHEFRKWYNELTDNILREHVPPKLIDQITDKIIPIIEARLPSIIKDTIREAIKQSILEGWRKKQLDTRGIKE